MEIKYLILLTIPFLLIIFVVITLITLLTPDKHEPKSSLNILIDKVISNELNLAKFILSVAFLAIMAFYFFISPLGDMDGFLEGVLTETVGMLFDIILLLVFVAYIKEKSDKNRKIERYEDEIDDFRSWNEKEATFRIIGNIRRLQKENVSKINLHDCYLKDATIKSIKLKNSNLSFSNLESTKVEFCEFHNCIFTESKMSGFEADESDFSDSEMDDCDLELSILRGSKLVNAILSSSILQESNFSYTNCQGAEFFNADLTKSKFIGANLKKADFVIATIIDADFTGANLEGADLSMAVIKNTNLTDVKLLGTKVHSIDFFNKLFENNITDNNVMEFAYQVNPNRKKLKRPDTDKKYPSMNDYSLDGFYYEIEQNPDYPNFDEWYYKKGDDLPF